MGLGSHGCACVISGTVRSGCDVTFPCVAPRKNEAINVNTFKESEVGITIPLSKVQKRVTEATRVSRRTLCRVLKEGENVETGVTMAFSTPRKLRPKVCTKSISKRISTVPVQEGAL